MTMTVPMNFMNFQIAKLEWCGKHYERCASTDKKFLATLRGVRKCTVSVFPYLLVVLATFHKLFYQSIQRFRVQYGALYK